MMQELFFLTLLAFTSASDHVKNSKRSISNFGFPFWNSLLANSWPSLYPWQPIPSAHGSLHPFSTSYSSKSHFNLGSSATHDIAAAKEAAKKATIAAALAVQRVQTAREQVVIQERVAAAKEAAAQAAIQRFEAAAQIAAALQKSEALAAAAAAVHKSAPASATVAHAAGHFSAGPWIHSKSVFGHWN